MVLQIRTFPDEVLRRENLPVEVVDEEIRTLLDNMAETMYENMGVGLAAPQVGVNKRVIVVDISAGEEPDGLMKLVNPQIVDFGEETVLGEEGCLSIPGEYEPVTRPDKVTVKALNEDGEELVIEADGFLARALQHEMDHLEGVLFLDRLSMLKRESMKKRIKKRIEAGDYAVTRK
ncbi:peptide deformylase [Limisalsivibrio acetivorans]|uniref:peptide deformylase n=1 Tax=Limisalsivibrio acetivorans TaxID=1304888 RepID=UPI0003B5429A|nr:peptide deformylase [Limisalsivibrio acetivorans]